MCHPRRSRQSLGPRRGSCVIRVFFPRDDDQDESLRVTFGSPLSVRPTRLGLRRSVFVHDEQEKWN